MPDAPTLHFLGGVGTVTGSKYLLTVEGHRVLLDCGLFQGLKELRLRNWAAPPFDPSSIDAVVLSHAHLDHSGYLPLLVRRGFRGSILCTPGTRELLPILLLDAAHLQEDEAERANRYGYSKHKPALPLYTTADAEAALTLTQGPMIIISASGMATGGRVLHHLALRLPDERTTVLLPGFQAAGTRGRALQEGADALRIFGRSVAVRSHVVTLDGFSAHADRNEILRWASGFERPPARVYVVHGEAQASRALAQSLHTELGWNAAVAKHGQAVQLER